MLYLVLKHLVLPPGAHVAAGLLAALAWRRMPRTAAALMLFTLVSLWALSTPLFAGLLASGLERFEPAKPAQIEAFRAEAILVLGGGARGEVREFEGFDALTTTTLERLRYGARLQRLTGLPLAVSGGAPTTSLPEGILMTTALEADFDTPVAFAEVESRNTAENATSSAQRFAFRRVVLVTHALHMVRAERAFSEAGFEVLPAPMGFVTRPDAPFRATDLLPGMSALRKSHYALYEYLGAVWYWLAYR